MPRQHKPVAAAARERLDALGLKQTDQRVLVLAELARERDDVTAQELHARLMRRGRPIGLATVYRTLRLLADHGAIDAIAHHPGELCYRLCSESHHHHLVCSSCHRVVELHECDLGPRLRALASEHGFVATDHQLEVVGVCAACA